MPFFESAVRRPDDYYKGAYYSAEFVGKNSWNGRESNFAYLNLDGSDFVEAGFALGVDSNADSRNVIAFDADNDGDQDLLILNTNGFASNLYINRLADSIGSRWLKVRPVGNDAINAVGATVRVRTGDRIQTQVVSTSNSYGASYVGPLLFGLGGAETVDSIEVTWPGGTKTVLESVAANQEVELRP
jgi:hypothetical protein